MKGTNSWLIIGGGSVVVVATIIFLPRLLETSYNVGFTQPGAVTGAIPLTEAPIVHVTTPSPVKALYMTACVASAPSWRNELKSVIDSTELNAVVIDIKDSTGTVSFPTDNPEDRAGRGCVAKDMKTFISSLHEAGIYVIGRISVFQDPTYATNHPDLAIKSLSTGGVWRDRKGLAFIDVGAKPYWDRIVTISKDAYSLGFDEINFDYVRYPSDGDLSDIYFSWTVGTSTRAEMLESFFSYLHTNLKSSTPAPVISADLFGMTTSVTNDMGIGQVFERALPYFDYIDPMVYPSHYVNGWRGFANPAEHPYEVVSYAMADGLRREQVWDLTQGRATSTSSKLRPWLQDFNLGAPYGPAEVDAEIKATYDQGLASWLVWNAGNRYTVAALQPDSGPLKAQQ